VTKFQNVISHERQHCVMFDTIDCITSRYLNQLWQPNDLYTYISDSTVTGEPTLIIGTHVDIDQDTYQTQHNIFIVKSSIVIQIHVRNLALFLW